MIRIGDNIRLTEKEKEDLRAVTGRPEVPATLAEYNRMLDVAILDWEGVDCAEGALMAAITKEMKLAAS